MNSKSIKSKEKTAIFIAILAAALYALNSPLSKLLLSTVSSTVMAGLLYLGAGVGLLIVRIIQKGMHIENKEQNNWKSKESSQKGCGTRVWKERNGIGQRS